MDISHLLDGVLAADPSRIALIVDDRRVTYADLDAAAASCAAVLAERGVGPGDRIATVAVGGVLSTAAILGAARLGAAAALMNVQLKPTELHELVRAAGCGAVGVASDRYRESLGSAVDGEVLGEAELLGSTAPAPGAVPDDDDLDALVLFTSGTTGLPKAIPIGAGTLSNRLLTMTPPFDPAAPPMIGLMCVPIFHVGGSLGLLGALYGGRTTVVQPRFDAGEWLRLVDEHRVSMVFVVPTMLQRILDHPDFATTDLSSLAAIFYGAAAAPVELVRRAIAALPKVAFGNVFGQTETLGAYTTLTPDDHVAPERIGSVGRPLPGVEIRVVDPVTEADVPSGEVGELWVLSDANVRPGWLRTGDLARQDADGYIYPSGRLSDTINRGGEKFGPIEIETVLREHPAVVDVAAAGIPDAEMGERVGVAVVSACADDRRRGEGLVSRTHRRLQDAGARGVRRRPALQRHRQSGASPARRAHRAAETTRIGGPMLFVHEVHRVVGAREDDFEAAFRDGWMPTLAEGDDGRLLWYANHAHGSGVSYNVVTITAVRDGAAWERLARRIQQGDLREWAREVDTYRHDVTAKTLLPVSWSPMQEVDLAEVPTDGAEHELSLFMEDTGWPYSSLDDYIKCWDEIYYRPMLAYAKDMQAIPIDIQACFQVAHGTHLRREAMLWQKIGDASTVLHLLTTDLPRERREPGRTCTTRSPSATSGRASCCAPAPGRRSTEALRTIASALQRPIVTSTDSPARHSRSTR